MRVFARMWASLALAIKHLIAERWLSAAALLGMTAAVVLAVCVPVYADSIYYRALSQELANAPADQDVERAPIRLQYRKLSFDSSGLRWQDLKSIDSYLTEEVSRALKLPLLTAERHAQTRPFLIFPEGNTAYDDTEQSIARLSVAFLSEFHSHITVSEGEWPEDAGDSATPLRVVVSEYQATRLGLQVGDQFTAIWRDGRDVAASIAVQIAGVWRPEDATDAYWFYAPEMLESMLLVPEDVFMQRIVGNFEGGISLVLWNLTLDGGGVHTYDVEPLQERVEFVQRQVEKMGGAFAQGPSEELESYRVSVESLTLQLYTYILPILALDILLLLQVAHLSADRRRNEFSVLRGRGATQRQLILAAGVEGSLLGILSLVFGLVGGAQLAAAMARTASFMQFTGDIRMRVALNRTAVGIGVAIAISALLLWLLHMAQATRETLIEYRQSRFRGIKVSWVGRLMLTLSLLVPGMYALWQLQQTGRTYNPFDNPLLFLIPTLLTLSAALMAAYILPLIAELFAKLFTLTRSTGVLMALRQIARQPRVYTMPLVLLISTLSMAVYTSSTAVSLERQTATQIEYALGADMVLYGEDKSGVAYGASAAPAFNTAAPPSLSESARYVFYPVDEYLNIEGVQAAARVGNYSAIFQNTQGSQPSQVLGVDRHRFSSVANWRDDYAGESLGGLMNALAAHPDGVLVPEYILQDLALFPGDRITLVVDADGENIEMAFTIVGSFTLFPSWQPMVWNTYKEAYVDKPLFVCNLDYIFQEAGGQFPYDVWLATKSHAEPDTIATIAKAMNLRVMGWQDADEDIARAYLDPRRQGVTGLLSVGFIGSAAFTVLSFVLYVAFSLRQRAITVAVLRSLGLTGYSLRVWLMVELCTVLVSGMLAGLYSGIYLAQLLIPALQIGTPETAVPPVQMVVALQAVTGLGLVMLVMFVLSVSVIVWRMVRMHLFASLKLGETL